VFEHSKQNKFLSKSLVGVALMELWVVGLGCCIPRFGPPLVGSRLASPRWEHPINCLVLYFLLLHLSHSNFLKDLKYKI
jgi:hypothetical protein